MIAAQVRKSLRNVESSSQYRIGNESRHYAWSYYILIIATYLNTYDKLVFDRKVYYIFFFLLGWFKLSYCRIAKWLKLPFVVLQFCASFSHEANDALSTSVSFLFVPGVNGGIWEGISGTTKKNNIYKLLHFVRKLKKKTDLIALNIKYTSEMTWFIPIPYAYPNSYQMR